MKNIHLEITEKHSAENFLEILKRETKFFSPRVASYVKGYAVQDPFN